MVEVLVAALILRRVHALDTGRRVPAARPVAEGAGACLTISIASLTTDAVVDGGCEASAAACVTPAALVRYRTDRWVLARVAVAAPGCVRVEA